MFVVAFTGHRPEKLGGYGAVNTVRDVLKESLSKRLLDLRAEHSDLRCISGMALGFDQWAVEVCIDLGIPFEAAIPFQGQESCWPEASQAHYRELLKKAATVTVVCEGVYAPWKMQRRNEHMTNNCDLLLAAWDGSSGGTANCVRYAQRIGKTVERLIW